MYRRCGFRYERKLRATGVVRIAGVDEAGRGALAGPVVAAAIVLPEKFKHRKLNDSKQLAPERREEIYTELVSNSENRLGCRRDRPSRDRSGPSRWRDLKCINRSNCCRLWRRTKYYGSGRKPLLSPEKEKP